MRLSRKSATVSAIARSFRVFRAASTGAATDVPPDAPVATRRPRRAHGPRLSRGGVDGVPAAGRARARDGDGVHGPAVRRAPRATAGQPPAPRLCRDDL